MRSFARMTARGPVRNRLISMSAVLTYAITALLLVPSPERRASLHYGLVITLGYGHLIGALMAPSLRSRQATPSRARRLRTDSRRRNILTVGVWLAIVIAFGAATTYFMKSIAFVFGLLAVSAWHTVENDLTLEDLYANGCRRVPLRAALDDGLASIGLTLALLAAASIGLVADAGVTLRVFGGTPQTIALLLRGLTVLFGIMLVTRERGTRNEAIGLALIGAGVLLPGSFGDRHGPAFADIFAVVTGYHLVSWLVVTIDRASHSGPSVTRILLATHTAPLFLSSICLLSTSPTAIGLREAFFAPAPYLFWSVAHVLHTLVLRIRGRTTRDGVPTQRAARADPARRDGSADTTT